MIEEREENAVHSVHSVHENDIKKVFQKLRDVYHLGKDYFEGEKPQVQLSLAQGRIYRRTRAKQTPTKLSASLTY